MDGSDSETFFQVVRTGGNILDLLPSGTHSRLPGSDKDNSSTVIFPPERQLVSSDFNGAGCFS